MVLGLTLLLALVAFAITIASALNPPRAPLWIAVLLLAILELVHILPR